MEKFQGKELAGRRLILEIAVFSGQSTKTEKDVPVPSKEPKTTTQTTSQVEKNEKSSAANLPGPSLQVVVCGVPSHVNKKSFKEIVQKVHHCKKLVVELVKEVGSHLFPSLT